MFLTNVSLPIIFIFSLLVSHVFNKNFTSELPRSDILHASSGLILHYLNDCSPCNRVISLTVSFPMTADMCYLIPINVIRKIPACQRSLSLSTLRPTYRRKRFLLEVVSIGVGTTALVLSTLNTIQVLNLKHEVKSLTNSLPTLTRTANTHTTQLLHMHQG